ncbi:ParB/RepB/Spo0J family partition protein [Rhodoferax antarcticus]|uniref:ParB-like nuclease domain protein n=1 Tax=Rhodoferax antarcticus ANT.BR TaxID=1111071 RepID=A0A1Q8Y9E2_9BURK|nr:ParB/RepB/Spo0J family partition protein [Rhodoferax antarcticus]OLP04651.1 parB-like nuclease domain protein [Rhodoferax antarcticus ANT.BR]
MTATATLQVSNVATSTPVAAKKQFSLHVPLNQLTLSPTNVRRVEPTGISELAQMIASQGLLNPLIVTRLVDQDGLPRYGVEAGGRRLRALQMLTATGALFADFPVECKLIDADSAIEVSLTENISQEGMHPADEFDAYHAMFQKGVTAAAIANKFGVTELHVQRRLKMAGIAAELFSLYRANELTLDQLMALAATDDQETQVRVWNSLPPYSRSAHQIKNQILQQEVPSSDKRVKVVSIEEYTAAGGEVRVDLFSEKDDAVFIANPLLLNELVAKHLEDRKAELLGAGWGWVETSLEQVHSYNLGSKYQQERPVPRAPTQEEQAKLDEMQDRLNDLNGKIDDCENDDGADPEEVGKLSDEAAELDQEIDALTATFIDTSNPNKATQGVIVFVGWGGIDCHYGLRLKGSVGDAQSGVGSAQGKVKPDFSERLMLNMTSHLTVALQASMIGNQKVALAAAAHRFAESLMDHGSFNNPVKINLTSAKYELEKNSDSLAANNGHEKVEKALDRWRQMLPVDKALWLDWFIGQPQGASLEMIALGTALATTAVHTTNGASQGNAHGLIKAVGLDMADFWAPTPETYLKHMPKGKIIDAVTEATSATVSEPMAKMKKDEAVQYAAAKLAGTRWLPSALKA